MGEFKRGLIVSVAAPDGAGTQYFDSETMRQKFIDPGAIVNPVINN